MKPEDQEYRSRIGENKDCTVKAMVSVSGLDYETVHKVFERHGRKKGRGIPLRLYVHAIAESLGMKVRLIKRSGSIGKLAEKYPKGKIVVTIRHHALAIVDGKISDWSSPRSHVRRAWIVE